MARDLGAQRRRAPPWASASGVGSDENAPPPGASDAAPPTPGAASRPPLRDIQPPPASGAKRKPQWPVTTPRKGLGIRAGKTPTRLGAASASLAPARSLRKPAFRLNFRTKPGASFTEVPRFKVREAISFWEENHNVQNDSTTLQRYDSHAPSKIEDCSNEDIMRNSESIIIMQLESNILKIILLEKIKAYAEVENRMAALSDELKAANLHILEVCRQKEATERVLNAKISFVEALEQIILTNDLEEPKKNNFQSPVFPNNSEDSPSSTELKRIQASLEKAHNLNTRYQQDQISRSFDEQEMDEVRRQVEMEMGDLILSLTEKSSSLKQLVDASNKNELLVKQSLEIIDLLLDECIEKLVQKEVLEQNYVSIQREMEEIIRQLKSQLYHSKICYEAELKELETKLQEMEDEAAASLFLWNKEKEVAL